MAVDYMKGLDPTQVALMEEQCILVDDDDKNIGSTSKKEYHKLENINKGFIFWQLYCPLFIILPDNPWTAQVDLESIHIYM